MLDRSAVWGTLRLRYASAMTILALLRHAKAVKDNPGGDHARRLSRAGQAAAEITGQRLRPLLPPDVLVIASDASRTRQTAELAIPSHVAALMWLEPALYAARPGVLLSFLRGLPADVPAAVLVGHNPGISELALTLAGEGDPADLARVAQGLATADAVMFTFGTSWADLAPKTGHVTVMLARKGGED